MMSRGRGRTQVGALPSLESGPQIDGDEWYMGEGETSAARTHLWPRDSEMFLSLYLCPLEIAEVR